MCICVIVCAWLKPSIAHCSNHGMGNDGLMIFPCQLLPHSTMTINEHIAPHAFGSPRTKDDLVDPHLRLLLDTTLRPNLTAQSSNSFWV